MDGDSAAAAEAADGRHLRSSSSTSGTAGFGGGGDETGPKCCRWNPTPEQVKVLTDLFRSGLRTPTTDQIQNISSHLSSFGMIESKNVFYWFQNHKARERHHQYSMKKRRRQQCRPPPHFHKNNVSVTTKVLSDNQNLAACHHSNVACGLDLEVAAGELEERGVETLELFPMTSQPTTRMIMKSTSRKNRNHHHREVAAPLFSTSFTASDLLLDLRLSSL